MTENMTVAQQQAAKIPDSLKDFRDQAVMMLQSGLLPTKFAGKPEAVVVTMLYGKELGLSPMQACKEIHVINGTPGISANLMLTLVRQRCSGFELQVMESSAKVNRLKHRRRPEDEWQVSEYTIEEATAAGLTGKDVWKKHPADMMFARNVSRVCRWNYSDLLAGFSHTPEELEQVLVKHVTVASLPVQGQANNDESDPEDKVDEDAIMELVAALLDSTGEAQSENIHNAFAETHSSSPATVGAAFDAHQNHQARMRRQQ